MKIIAVDNFDSGSINDFLICENVSEHYGRQIVNFLNKRISGPESSIFFKLVLDDYKLFTFQP